MALEDVQLASRLQEKGIRDQRVLDAIARLDRRRFLPEAVQAEAGDDAALPIGFGQTISQPYVVAYMTAALDVRPGQRILEIGTGSGYQAAVLVELGAQVFSIERVAELSAEAHGRLTALGYGPPRLQLRCGDGREGWPEAAPFEGIIVTAAADQLPKALISQLSPQGRLIAPLGSSDDNQQLVMLRRHNGELEPEWLLPVRFVPLVGSDEPPAGNTLH